MTQPIVRPRVATHAGHDVRLDKIERALATGQETLRPKALPGRGGRAADIVVAASDSLPDTQAGADFVCGGAGDATALQVLMDNAYALSTWGIAMLLLPGQYDWDSDFHVRNGCSLFGCGYATHLEGSGGSITMHDDGNLHDLILRTDGLAAGDYAISESSSDVVSIYNVWLYDLGGSKGIEAGNYWRIENCEIWGYDADAVVMANSFTKVVGSNFINGGVRFASRGFHVVTDSSFIAEPISAATFDTNSADNLFADNTVIALGSPDNTTTVIDVIGAASYNNILDNVIRSNSDAAGAARPKYGIHLGASTVGNRVRGNDLRDGVVAGPTWGTAAIQDDGTASIVAGNDT